MFNNYSSIVGLSFNSRYRYLHMSDVSCQFICVARVLCLIFILFLIFYLK